MIIAHEVCLGTAPEAHVLAMSSPFARLATGLLLAGCRRTTGQRGLQLRWATLRARPRHAQGGCAWRPMRRSSPVCGTLWPSAPLPSRRGCTAQNGFSTAYTALL